MRRGKSKEVAFMGLLFALVLALSFAETMLTSMLLLPPGVKPGLANVVVMFCLLCRNKREAVILIVLKAGFALLTRGFLAATLSAAGGVSSMVLMMFLLWLPQKPSVFIVSICGALTHNAVQLMVFSALLGGPYVWTYAPALLVSGVLAGGLTTLLLRALLPSLYRMGFATQYSELQEKRTTEDAKK